MNTSEADVKCLATERHHRLQLLDGGRLLQPPNSASLDGATNEIVKTVDHTLRLAMSLARTDASRAKLLAAHADVMLTKFMLEIGPPSSAIDSGAA